MCKLIRRTVFALIIEILILCSFNLNQKLTISVNDKVNMLLECRYQSAWADIHSALEANVSRSHDVGARVATIFGQCSLCTSQATSASEEFASLHSQLDAAVTQFSDTLERVRSPRPPSALPTLLSSTRTGPDRTSHLIRRLQYIYCTVHVCRWRRRV